MPKIADLKNGSIVAIEGQPHAVEALQVQTPSARGGASLYKIRFRNLVSKQKLDRSFKGDDMVADQHFERCEVQFMYQQDDRYTFMELSDYSQFELGADEISDVLPYLVEGLEGLHALIADERILGLELPHVVELEIADCGPSMKGASATARTKPATMATGLVVQVPEYLAPAEIIRVDTRTGKFLSRG